MSTYGDNLIILDFGLQFASLHGSKFHPMVSPLMGVSPELGVGNVWDRVPRNEAEAETATTPGGGINFQSPQRFLTDWRERGGGTLCFRR